MESSESTPSHDRTGRLPPASYAETRQNMETNRPTQSIGCPSNNRERLSDAPPPGGIADQFALIDLARKITPGAVSRDHLVKSGARRGNRLVLECI